MKKLIFILSFTILVLSWSFSAHAERKFSVIIPADSSIPAKASVSITKYERALPAYGECAGGEACYVMGLSKFCITQFQEDIHKASGRKSDIGCNSRELYHASMNLGIDVESYMISNVPNSKEDRLSYLDALKYFISQGYPVVISWDEDPKMTIDDFCSFALVVGYNDENEEIKVVDPYVGTLSGRIFSYKEFLDHWQWDNSDRSFTLFMDVVKGKLKAPKDRLKTVTFHITEGQTIELVYIEKTRDQTFFNVGFKESDLIVHHEMLDEERKRITEYLINTEDNPNFEVWGGGEFFFRFTSEIGQGDISITYEPKDGDLFLKQ